MAANKPLSLMQRRKQQLQRLGALAPQFSVAFDVGLGKRDLFRRLPFKRSWIAIAIVGAFLLAFSLPLFSVAGPFFEEPDDSLFSLIFLLFSAFWMLGWSTGVLLIAVVFLVLLFGQETLRVQEGKLILRIGMAGFGFGASYDAALIRNFRTATKDESVGNSWRGDHLVFEYANEPVHFGSAISGEQARQLLQQLRLLFPQQGTPAPDLAQLTPEAIAQTGFYEAPDEPAAVPVSANQEAPTLGSISTLALLIANLIPLLGVLFAGWSIGEIMLLFWAESAVIGFYNLCKLWQVGRWSALFYGPFFVGHYGAFMAGHLLFIYAFFGSNFADGVDITSAEVGSDLLRLWPALLAFFISHGISYVVNFLGRAEYRQRNVSQQMGEPYKRIIIMHVTIIFGGFLAMLLSSALPALILLILLKLVADVRGHLREHRVAS